MYLDIRRCCLIPKYYSQLLPPLSTRARVFIFPAIRLMKQWIWIGLWMTLIWLWSLAAARVKLDQIFDKMKKADFLISGSNSDISLKYLIFWVKVSIKVFFKKLKLALIGLHRKYIFFWMNMNVFAMLERFFFSIYHSNNLVIFVSCVYVVFLWGGCFIM